MVCPTLIESIKGAYITKKITYSIKDKINEIAFFFVCLMKFKQKPLVVFTVIILAIVYFNTKYSLDGAEIDFLSNVAFFLKKDNSVLELITFITNIIGYSIPLSATFYYFIYKEQKTLSESSLNVNGNPFLHFICMTLLIVVIGKHLQLLIGNIADNQIDFKNTLTYVGKIAIFSVILVIYTYRVWKLVNYFLDSTNVRSFLDRIIDDVSKTIELLFRGSNYLDKKLYKSTLKQIYSKLNCAIEGTYQLLLQTISKDMTEAYY